MEARDVRSLELELQTNVNHLNMSAGNCTWVLWKSEAKLSLQFYLYPLNILCSFCMYMNGHVCMPQCMYRAEKTTSSSQFSPSRDPGD